VDVGPIMFSNKNIENYLAKMERLIKINVTIDAINAFSRAKTEVFSCRTYNVRKLIHRNVTFSNRKDMSHSKKT